MTRATVPLPSRAALLTIVILAGLATGCSGDDPTDPDAGPDPDAAASVLATGLAAGDLADVTFAGATGDQAQQEYDAVVAGMDEVPRRVEVAELDRTGDKATATLSWTWEVAEKPWRYDATADLSLVGDAWQVTWAATVIEPTLVAGETMERSSITPDRGDILGAGGLAIVAERPVVRIGIDKPFLGDAKPQAAARDLAQLVGIDPASYAKAVGAAGPKAFVEAIVYRRDEVPLAVTRGLPAIPGAKALPDTLPLAPTREFAAPILGRVGEVTAEMIEEDPDRYQVGDVAGLSGLQARYDDQLRGAPGVSVEAYDEEGNARGLYRFEPRSGKPLKLSLDIDLQTQAEALLADVGPASALVALKPSTGEIVAAANGPGTEGLNLATYGQFAPGSTFKSVSSLALLRAGLTPNTVIPCTSRIVVDGKEFTNYSDYPTGGLGDIPLRTALANSCNTAFISQAGKLKGTDLFDAAVSLGLGLDHDLGFPAYFGSVEPPASETEAAAQLIGQGTILASPMVMATVIGSVQQGELVIPRMVDGVEVSAPEGAQPLSAGEAGRLKAMLRGVVLNGSGRGLADVPGPPVIAKTGTAEFGSGADLQTHAWMIAAQGDLAVAVFVEVGVSGSQTAGPILEAFLRAAR
jgi:Penicillin binding protein transpeptidase domain/Penicillin-binding Protein dimerisation domain